MLETNGITHFIQKLKEKNTYLERLQIKYHPRADKPYAKLSCYGMEDIHQDSAYYENISEHIDAANMSWIEPLCNAIKAPMTASIDIDEDGNFVTSEIKVTVDVFTPQKIDAVIPFLYERIKPFVLLNDYMDSVEVKGMRGTLRCVKLNMTLDSSKVMSLLKNNKVNRATLNQWLASINNSVKVNAKEQLFENIFYVVNGKINVEYKTELVDQYFAL